MNKITFQAAIFLFALIVSSATHLFPQAGTAKEPREKIWFIARVLNIEPFVLEYLDDWYRHRPSAGRYADSQVGADINPQSQFENVKKFQIGDIISGETCHPWMGDCGGAVRVSEANNSGESKDYSGMSIPPSIAINLRRLGKSSKTKYERQGGLFYYKHADINTVNGLTILRDGRVFVNKIYGEVLERKLSPRDLEVLKKLYSESKSVPYDSSVNYSESQIIALSPFYQHLSLKRHLSRFAKLVAAFDSLSQAYVRDASYSIRYQNRLEIKVWKYGDILPLDEAIHRGSSFFTKNYKRLSTLPAPAALLLEAKTPYGELQKYLYEYKGKIYGFEIGNCLGSMTDTWGCFNAAEMAHLSNPEVPHLIYDRWPRSLGTRLKNISKSGSRISPDDLEKNRAFYMSLLYGARLSYREDNFVYRGISVDFH